MRWLANDDDPLVSSANNTTRKIYWRMGCAYSQGRCDEHDGQSRCDDHDSTVFEAYNIDSDGNVVSAGKIKVTESDISFLYNNNLAVWPLKCLRRYGYDEQIFSFEAGRRCRSGPGIYAFTCEKADQLFNLVQQNILVCSNSDERSLDERILGDRPIQRVIIPEPNYLEPTPARSNALPFSQSRNGRLCSIGSSSGPMSPQGTMGTPSPPPVPPLLPSSLHTAAAAAAAAPLYTNEVDISQAVGPVDAERNNNKSLGKRLVQRSDTVSSSTLSSVFLSSEQVSASQTVNGEVWATNQDGGGASAASQSSAPSYMNVDLGSDACPLSPSLNSNCDSSLTCLKKEPAEALDTSCDTRAYMNVSISPDQSEKAESMVPTIIHTGSSGNSSNSSSSSKPRPPALPILPIQLETDDEFRHSYANLGASELETLKKRYSVISFSDKPSNALVQTPPPYSSSSREMRYAVLNLDKKVKPPQPPPPPPMVKTSRESVAASVTPTATTATSIATSECASTATATTATTTTTTTTTSLAVTAAQDPRQNGYVTIDFDKTNALSHSAISNMSSSDVIPDEGSRKTRHNSTIGELMAS